MAARSSAIAFYAHKGGVGKSTLIFDVAYDLAINHNRTVFVIDTDSQLNTTFKLLKRSNYSIDNQFIDELLAQDHNHLNVNLRTTPPPVAVPIANPSLAAYPLQAQVPAVPPAPAFPARQGLIPAQARPTSTLYSYLCGVAHPFNGNDFITIANTNNRIKLLIGSPILHNLELQLINAIINPQNNPATAAVPLLFMNLCNAIKAQNPGAVILVDMSPNSNYVNQNILLSCDYFLLPCNADDNSMMSLKLLFNYLHTWRQNHANYLPPQHLIKFVAAILNRYKVGDVDNQLPTMMNNQFLHRIIGMINEFRLRVNINNQQATYVNWAYDLGNPNKLLKVQNGMRFSEVASEECLTVLELTGPICRRNGVKFDERKVGSMISEIADITSELLNNNII